MTPESDDTIAMRDEDALDVAAVDTWLRSAVPHLPEGQLPLVRQFAGGASNLTYLLTYEGDDRASVELVLRQPPRGLRAASAHDMGREVSVQQLLRPHYPFVPEILGYCTDLSVIGSEFYVMERLHGLILRRDLPAGLSLSPAVARTLADKVIDAQADLHCVDPAEVGLDGLGRGPGYVGRQVAGWSRRYRDARTDDVPDGESVMTWLDVHQPADAGARIIHGDWRFDNLVLALDDDPHIVGVLDWELATVGDPLMDLGSSMAYWITADDDPGYSLLRRQPTNLPGMPTRDEYVARYLERTGLVIDDWRFYEVFGLFRLAVIAQQIWFRYRRGETTNPAFASFGAGVRILIDRATACAHAP